MHHQVTRLHSMGRTLLKLNYFHQRLKWILPHLPDPILDQLLHHATDKHLLWIFKRARKFSAARLWDSSGVIDHREPVILLRPVLKIRWLITSWLRHDHVMMLRHDDVMEEQIILTSWCRLLELILELPWYSGGAHPPRFNPGTYANFSLVRPRKITIPLCGISKGACHPFGMYAIGTPASPGCSTCIFPPITEWKIELVPLESCALNLNTLTCTAVLFWLRVTVWRTGDTVWVSWLPCRR